MKRIACLLFLFFFIFSCDTVKPPIKFPEPVTGGEIKTGNAKFNYWRHSPLHPPNMHPVSFHVAASDDSGINKVELHIYEYELYQNSERLPSKRRRVSGVWGLVNTWTSNSNEKTVQLAYEFSNGFPAASNVVYEFKIFNKLNEVSSRIATFDAGNSPWSQDKILLYSTADEPMKNNINLCFLPDVDYDGDYSTFITDVEKMIFEGYHSNNMLTSHKDMWAFYYTRQEVDGLNLRTNYDIEELYPPFMRDSIIPGIDAFALLHQDEYSDGALLVGNISFLSNNMFTSESYNHGTAIHETAHAVFGLSDEYSGCACFEGAIGSNMFRSLNACQQFNTATGYAGESCTEIINYNGETWWMAEHPALFETQAACESYNTTNGLDKNNCGLFIDIDGKQWYRATDAVCIMQDDGDRVVRSFQRVCATIIDRYYQSMESGIIAANNFKKELVENHFGYEPVVLMELDMIGNDMDLQVMKVGYGVPTKSLLRDREMKIQLEDASGLLQYQLSTNRPGRVLTHNPEGKDQLDEVYQSHCSFSVPFKQNLAKAVCDWKKKNDKTEVLQSRNIREVFDLEKVLKGKHINFNK